LGRAVRITVGGPEPRYLCGGTVNMNGSERGPQPQLEVSGLVGRQRFRIRLGSRPTQRVKACDPRTRHQADCGLAETSNVPAAKPLYGVLNVSVRNQRSDAEAGTVIALVFLVTALAAATIWFVALPLFDRPHRAPQDCRAFVLTKSGVTKCIPEATPGEAISG
jgi:hypothetical protein